jgi:hypothetical protein
MTTSSIDAPRVVGEYAPTAVRGRLLVLLLAGRGAFRAANQLTPLLLAVAWGPVQFGEYAGAVGLASWIMYVAFSGEKAVLKVVPRAARIGPRVSRLTLALAATPVVAVLAATAVTLLIGPRTAAIDLLLLAALISSGIGLLQVVAALHRLRGAPGHDGLAFLSLAALTVATTLTTVHLGWSPRGQIGGVGLAVLMVLIVMLARLPQGTLTPAARPAPTHRIAGRFLRACVLLGLPELLGSVSVAVCYLILALTTSPAENARFYLAMVVSGVCSAGVVYLLRLGQPAMSVRLRGPAAATGRRHARRLLGAAIAAWAFASVALAVAFVTASPAAKSSSLLLAAVTGVEIPLFAMVSFAGFILENTDGRALLVTSRAAVGGLVATALAAAVLVPAIGASGAMGALVCSQGAVAIGMLVGLYRQHPVGTPMRLGRFGFRRERWNRAYARVVRSSFATVPFYRERWALSGRPGAVVTPEEIQTRGEDLEPIAGARPRDRGRSVPEHAGTLRDPLLGELAMTLSCGQWHVDWPRVYARQTPSGVAFTLLRQRSPRLVDIVVDPSLRLSACPRHGSPVVTR